MPLIMAKPGVVNIIKNISGKEETKQFLNSLGFVVGGEIIVINELNGNLIVNIKGTRIAISKDMAAKITI